MDTLLTESIVLASLLLASSELLQERRGFPPKGAQLLILGYHGTYAACPHLFVEGRRFDGISA
jgi:hypothetical protein